MWPFSKSPETRVKEAMTAFPSLKDVTTTVVGEIAVFKGTVEKQQHRRILETVALGVSDIKSVDTAGLNILEKEEPATPAPDPTALSRALIEKIRAEASLQNNPIDVIQKDSSLILSGAVDSAAEQTLVITLAKSIAGVSSVDAAGLTIETGAAEKAAEAKKETYTIKKGDTLGAIAKMFYGDVMKYKHLAKINNIANPDKIEVGQVLTIDRVGAANA